MSEVMCPFRWVKNSYSAWYQVISYVHKNKNVTIVVHNGEELHLGHLSMVVLLLFVEFLSLIQIWQIVSIGRESIANSLYLRLYSRWFIEYYEAHLRARRRKDRWKKDEGNIKFGYQVKRWHNTIFRQWGVSTLTFGMWLPVASTALPLSAENRT